MSRKKLAGCWILVCFIFIYSTQIFAGIWQQENEHWQYQEDGQYVSSKWISEQGNWYYLNDQGLMQTGWLLDQGNWYYFNQSGEMLANRSDDINGTIYSFDYSGKMTEQTIVTGWDANTYRNTAFNYSITLPAGYNMVSSNTVNTHFALEKEKVGFAALSFPITDTQNINQLIPSINNMILSGLEEPVSSSHQSAVNLGGYAFIKVQNYFEKSGNIDFYYRQVDSNIYCLITTYPANETYKVGQVLKSLKKLY